MGSVISGHLGDYNRVQVCGVQLWKNILLLQGSNSCKLSVCPLQAKEKIPWTTQATELWVLLTLTKAECRYMLCGMITAPTMPTACSICGVRQPEQDGRNMPLRTWIWLGFTVTYYIPTEQLLAFTGIWDQGSNTVLGNTLQPLLLKPLHQQLHRKWGIQNHPKKPSSTRSENLGLGYPDISHHILDKQNRCVENIINTLKK